MVELGHQAIHPLTGTNDDARRRWTANFEQPADCEGNCGHGNKRVRLGCASACQGGWHLTFRLAVIAKKRGVANDTIKGALQRGCNSRRSVSSRSVRSKSAGEGGDSSGVTRSREKTCLANQAACESRTGQTLETRGIARRTRGAPAEAVPPLA